MIQYDPRTGGYYDDATGEWVDAPAQPEGLMSLGQMIAALVMLPLIIVWVGQEYGIDVLALIGLPL